MPLLSVKKISPFARVIKEIFDCFSTDKQYASRTIYKYAQKEKRKINNCRLKSVTKYDRFGVDIFLAYSSETSETSLFFYSISG